MLFQIFIIATITAPVASHPKLSPNQTLSITVKEGDVESFGGIYVAEVESETTHHLLNLTTTQDAIFQTVNVANLL